MPPKRKTTRSKVSLKQQRMLKSRLMQISLRLDEYVYKNESISVAEAEEYIDEIASYKTQGCVDVHSMQVIEKLTRCMTGVINEQLNVNAENTNKQYNGIIGINETQTCASPVYSLPDEDKLFTQAAVACKENFTNNIDSYCARQNVDKGCLNDNVESQIPVEYIDLCSGEEDNTFNIATVDVEVHRALSNLSIIDIEGPTVNYESQSILKNCEVVSQPNITCIAKGTKVNSIVQIATKPIEVTEEQSQNIPGNFNQNKTQSDYVIHEAVIIHNIQQNNNNDGQDKTTSLIQNVKKNILKGQHATNISKSRGVTKPTRINTVKFTPPMLHNSVQEITNIPKEKNTVEKNLNTKKTSKKRNDKNKTNGTKSARKRKTKKDGDTTQNSTIKIKKSNPTNKPRVGVITSAQEMENKNQNCKDDIPTRINTEIFTKANSLNANSIPIYNKRIENDLSWVENIRYVREITTNEFDPKLTSIDESFWNNLTLPSDWNDKEFDI